MTLLTTCVRKFRRSSQWIVGAGVFILLVIILYIHLNTGTASSKITSNSKKENEDLQEPTTPIPVKGVDSNVPYDKSTWPPPNYDVHVFYYAWYGTPAIDGDWYHWNHRFLPHWDSKQVNRYPQGRHEPPKDIGSNFFPKLGAYSSRDPDVVEEHMYQIRKARIGVVAVSWYPNGQSDDEGKPPDPMMTFLLDKADKYDLKICFHIEPFNNRNAETVRAAITYIIDKYGEHPAFYKRKTDSGLLPLFYIYDSYQVVPKEWNKLFGRISDLTVRGTKYDGIFIGLVVESSHTDDIYNGGFDGMYTYFASNTFVFGSIPSNWNKLSGYCKTRQLLFIPSIGPGYVDTEVRRWNGRNTKNRDDGKYYRHNFKMALTSLPDIVSITSFNEWHEGTQIEPAVPRVRGYGQSYLDYGKGKEYMYIDLTRELIESMPSTKKT